MMHSKDGGRVAYRPLVTYLLQPQEPQRILLFCKYYYFVLLKKFCGIPHLVQIGSKQTRMNPTSSSLATNMLEKACGNL